VKSDQLSAISCQLAEGLRLRAESLKQLKPLGSLLRGTFFVLLLGGSFLQQAAWGYEEPELSIETSSTEVPVGAHFELRASLKWEGSQSSDFVVLKATPPENESVKLLESKTATSSRLTQDGTFSQKSYIFTYKALKAGEMVLDPVLFEIAETSDLEQTDFLRTEETSIRILPTWIFYLKKLALPGAGITLLVLVTGGAFLGWDRYRKKRIREEKAHHTFDAEKEILKTIHEVNRYQVFGDLKTFYSRMRERLFNYVEKKYGISFFDKNESEIQFW